MVNIKSIKLTEIVILQNEFLKLNSVGLKYCHREKVKIPPLLQTTIGKPQQRKCYLMLLEIRYSYVLWSATHDNHFLEESTNGWLVCCKKSIMWRWNKEPDHLYGRTVKKAEYTFIRVPRILSRLPLVYLSPLPLGSGCLKELSFCRYPINHFKIQLWKMHMAANKDCMVGDMTDCKICFKTKHTIAYYLTNFRFAPIVLEQS